MSEAVASALSRLLESTKKAQTKQKTLQEAQEIHVAEIVRHGDQLLIPENMTLEQAQQLIQQRAKYEETKVVFRENIPVFPWDGALAMARVLEREFGWAQGVPQQSFFGSTPPQLVTVEVDVGKTASVPWGEFSLQGVEGKITTGSALEKDLVVFSMTVEVKRKHEIFVKRFIQQVREEALANSIYRGKAVRVSFYDDSEGEWRTMPIISFMDTRDVTRDSAIYSRSIEEKLERDLFIPITRSHDMIANNIPVKTGVLLTGTYGTGKTLAATVASKLAVDSGLLYVYVAHAFELPRAIAFARQYQSPAAVVFVEDIDRETSGNRSDQMDQILNTIDGIDGKTSNIIVVLTTNDLEAINPAMIRPGRLDSIIDVTPPDSEAAVRLVRKIAGKQLNPGEDLTAVGERLAGQIPAVIVEVVKRAKRWQIAHLQPGEKITTLGADAILDAADSIVAQVEILRKATEKELPSNAEVYANMSRYIVLNHGFADEDFNLDYYR